MNRIEKTRGYPGVKRKKNNRSSRSSPSNPETCPKIPADIKNFCSKNARKRKNYDTDKRNEITLQTGSEKLETSALVYMAFERRIDIVADIIAVSMVRSECNCKKMSFLT